MPEIRYLHVRTDGRPQLDAVAALGSLRALIIETSGLRGELDPLGFPDLRWLRIGLGGKGGAAVLPAIERGHARLEWLALREVKARVATDLCAGFPKLRVLRIGYADYLRGLGGLAAVTPNLEKLALYLTQIRSLDGLAGLHWLETLELFGGRVRDLAPLRALSRLRYARLELPDVESIEPLRNHLSLRMVGLTMAGEPDLSVLASIPRLATVMGFPAASVALGAIWALWHQPLFFLANTDTTGQPFARHANACGHQQHDRYRANLRT